MTIERIPLLEEPTGASGEHPDSASLLTSFQSITAVCEDCGHAAVLDWQTLMARQAVSSFGHLGRHAYWAPYRAAGATRANVTLRGLPLDSNPDPQPPSPRERQRSDPNPNLPRGNLFDRRISNFERMKVR